MIKAPDSKVSYAVICEKYPDPCIYFDSYDLALKWANINQPDNLPFYIVKRIEHFEVCKK